jgi:hypothetical protein
MFSQEQEEPFDLGAEYTQHLDEEFAQEPDEPRPLEILPLLPLPPDTPPPSTYSGILDSTQVSWLLAC